MHLFGLQNSSERGRARYRLHAKHFETPNKYLSGTSSLQGALGAPAPKSWNRAPPFEAVLLLSVQEVKLPACEHHTGALKRTGA